MHVEVDNLSTLKIFDVYPNHDFKNKFENIFLPLDFILYNSIFFVSNLVGKYNVYFDHQNRSSRFQKIFFFESYFPPP